MEQILMNLAAGALGGIATGKASPSFDLGMLGNTLAGLAGGGILGQLITLLMPAVTAAAASGDLSVGNIVTHLVGGGVGGAALTALIGSIKNRVA